MEYRVDVTCKNEKIDVATVKTSGPLDAATLGSLMFLHGVDGNRYPIKSVADSEIMRCLRCSGALAFRLADGSLHEAIPGVLKVTG